MNISWIYPVFLWSTKCPPIGKARQILHTYIISDIVRWHTYIYIIYAEYSIILLYNAYVVCFLKKTYVEILSPDNLCRIPTPDDFFWSIFEWTGGRFHPRLLAIPSLWKWTHFIFHTKHHLPSIPILVHGTPKLIWCLIAHQKKGFFKDWLMTYDHMMLLWAWKKHLEKAQYHHPLSLRWPSTYPPFGDVVSAVLSQLNAMSSGSPKVFATQFMEQNQLHFSMSTWSRLMCRKLGVNWVAFNHINSQVPSCTSCPKAHDWIYGSQ